VLVEVVIDDDKPTTKESAATLKNSVNAKKKKSTVSIEKITGKRSDPFLRMVPLWEG